MRTSDRTYLQTLGFQDQDKNNPLHDKACLYLAQPDKVKKLATLLYGDTGPTFTAILYCPQAYLPPDQHKKIQGHTCLSAEKTGETRVEYKPLISEPIEETIRGYNTTTRLIGYADLILHLELKATYKTIWESDSQRRVDTQRTEPLTVNAEMVAIDRHKVLVEVKAGKSSPATIIQQLKTYRRSESAFDIVIATLYKLSSVEKALFKSEGFEHIYLDPAEVNKTYDGLCNQAGSEDPAF